MTHPDTLIEHTKIRMIAGECLLRNLTGSAASVIPIPGTERVIATGTKDEIAKLLEVATPSVPVSQAPDLAAIRDQVLEEAARKVESFRQTMHIPTMTEVAAAIRAMRGGDQSQKHLPGWERGIATVILSGHQLREALDFINPDGDDDPEQREETLTFGIVKHKADDGAEAVGMCCWNDDTDGVLPLDGAASTPGSEQ